MMEQLIAKVFMNRDHAHLQHWATKSYAEHMALGAFYAGAVDLIDAIVEEYQGQFAMIGEVEPETIDKDEDIRECLQETADWIEANRDELSNGSNSLGNQLDTLTSLYNKTIYLLSLQ